MTNYHELLLKRKSELEESLETLKDAAKPVDLNDPIGRLSRMDAMQQQQMALNSKNQMELALKLVDQALVRLQNEEYGICLSCEEDISEKRLKARPETPFCTKCQK